MKRNYFVSSVALVLASFGLLLAAGSAHGVGYGNIMGLLLAYGGGILMGVGLCGAVYYSRAL